MMDNTPSKKCRKSSKNRHIRPPFSPFYLRKCLTNSGLIYYRKALKRRVTSSVAYTDVYLDHEVKIKIAIYHFTCFRFKSWNCDRRTMSKNKLMIFTTLTGSRHDSPCSHEEGTELG